MEFYDVVGHVLELLQRQKRVSYRALKRQFSIDDNYIEDLKEEFLYAHESSVQADDRGLIWIGDNVPDEPPISEPDAESRSPETTESERAPASYTPTYLAEKILTGKTSLEGERKVVTVLFADIKDSTELIRDLDPEDAQKLLDPAIHIMMEAVHRFEGTVNQVLGDGVMSIFGAPIAHEDHAARACYAALAMQSAMRDYTDEVRRRQGLELRIRVGLNSGEVVVRTIGNDLHMDYSAVGPPTHLAARMEQLASPGSIRLSSSTLRLVEGLVQVNDLGPVPVKGMDEPVAVYELIGASAVRRRLQAAIARGLTKFVGRSVEIDALNQALEQAGSGHGQLVAAVGEAGVGKSRLMYEFVHSHRTQGWLVLESASVSYGKATPYFPVIDLLKCYVHVEDGDDARTIRAKVTGQILTLDESLQDTIPALLSLLDALPEDSPFLQLDPPQRRQRTLDGLKRILLCESQVQPLVLVFEDLHWHDNESQALLDSLVESLPTAQLLLLVNYRPEYSHGWGSKTYYTQLRLDPLPPESSDQFLSALLGNNASLEPLKTLLIERTEGNPFFLEESVRTLVETQGLVGEPGAYRLAQDLPTIQVPATVQAILAARIDRLSQDEKRLLQTAAVIGTEVPLPLLQAIAEMSEEALHRGLTHLQAAEFVYETSLFPERIYTFKHALTHEVTYGSLLQERRRVLHARIVDTLEVLGGDRLSEQVERLAHHAMRGEVWDKALLYFRRAGQRARTHVAWREAVAYDEQALEALKHLPETREMLEQNIDVHFELRAGLTALGELKHVPDRLRTANTLAEAIGDPVRQGRVALYMALHFSWISSYADSMVASEHALALAMSIGDIGGQVQANNYLGIVFHALGNYRRAMQVLRQAKVTLTGEQCYERFGQVSLPAVLTRTCLGLCLAEVGEFHEGLINGNESLHVARTVAYPVDMMGAYYALGLPYLYKGEFSSAISFLERALMIADEVVPPYFPVIASDLGRAYALSGRGDDALTLLERAEAQLTGMKMTWLLARIMTCGSEAALVTGRLEEATVHAQRALEFSQTYKERGNEAWARRSVADIARHRNPPDIEQAETHYQQALTLANELGMRPLRAHCHRGLGTLYRQTGQSEQARSELSIAIEMYRDMEMSFWVPETEAALTAVEGR